MGVRESNVDERKAAAPVDVRRKQYHDTCFSIGKAEGFQLNDRNPLFCRSRPRSGASSLAYFPLNSSKRSPKWVFKLVSWRPSRLRTISKSPPFFSQKMTLRESLLVVTIVVSFAE